MSMEKFKPVSRNIAGHVVEVAPLPARYSLLYKFKLLQLLGGPLVDLIKGPIAGLLKNFDLIKKVLAEALKEDKVDPNVDDKSKSNVNLEDVDLNLDSLSARMFDTLDPEKSTQLVFDICASARVDGRELTEGVINEVFSGDLITLYKVFFFVLEVNYKDFLGVLGTTKKVAPNQAKK